MILILVLFSSLEVDILHHALQAQCDMTEWKFLPSLLHLNESHSKLATWGQLLPALSSKEVCWLFSIIIIINSGEVNFINTTMKYCHQFRHHHHHHTYRGLFDCNESDSNA